MKCRKREPDHSSIELETEVRETVEECTVGEEPVVHEVTVTSVKRVPVYVDLTVESVEGTVVYLDGETTETGIVGKLLPAAEVGDPSRRTFRFRLKRGHEDGVNHDTLRVRLRYYLREDEREEYKNDSFPDVHPEVDVA